MDFTVSYLDLIIISIGYISRNSWHIDCLMKLKIGLLASELFRCPIVRLNENMNEQYIYLIKSRIAEFAIGSSTLRNQGAPGVVKATRKFLRNIRLKHFSVLAERQYEDVLNRYTYRLKATLPIDAQNWGGSA